MCSKFAIIAIVLFTQCSLFLCGFQGQSPANNESPFASIVYTAVIRGKVALPCDVTPPTADDSVALILWYKDEALAPIYTLDARKGDVEQARTLTTISLDGRAYFNLKNRPAFLQIDPIRLMDAGDYRCRVDFKKARTVNTVISLKVIVPPDEPRISSADGKQLKGLIGPFNEGDRLTLICTTNGGKPRPSLIWWRDFVIFDDTFEYNEKDVTTNQLTIASLARHHLLSIFMCQAINNNITVPSSTAITLDLNLKPTEVHITQLTPTIVADKQATFECKTFGSRPKSILYWSFNGERHTTAINGDQQLTTNITITARQEYNGQYLTCTAENPKIPNSAITDQLKLDIHYVPQLSLKFGTSSTSIQSIREGSDVYFECHIDANPLPKTAIIWRFNGITLQKQRQGITQSNQSLVLRKVSRTQTGTYECEASNEYGSATSNQIQLLIKYAPVCRTNVIMVYGVSLHEELQLKCDVNANPSDVQFEWKFYSESNKSLKDLINFNQINDTSSILNYTPHASQQFGSIECVAKNEVGPQQKPCVFVVTSPGPPQFPFNCQLINQSDNTLVILCVYKAHSNARLHYSSRKQVQQQQQPQNVYVYPQTRYVCEVYDTINSYLVANVSTSFALSSLSANFGDNHNLHFVVTGLSSATRFRVKLYAQNSKGKSGDLWIKAQTTRSAERLIDSYSDGSNNASSFVHVDHTLLRSKPLISVIIAIAVVTVLAIAFIVIGVLRSRRTRWNRNRSRNETADSHQQQSASATLFNEEEDCCCEEECCDEMLLTTANEQCNSKGAPDIIPSFGYSSSALQNKQFMSFDEMPEEQRPRNECDALHTLNYAQVTFADEHNGSNCKSSPNERQQQHQQQQQQQQSAVEYPKIEFTKSQRVNVIDASPKFESTV